MSNEVQGALPNVNSGLCPSLIPPPSKLVLHRSCTLHDTKTVYCLCCLVKPRPMTIMKGVTVLGSVCAFILPHPSAPPRTRYWSSQSNVKSLNPNSESIWEGLHVRPGTKEDEGTIRRTLAGMLMNPLFINVQNFVCAEEDGELVGFGQVRPIGIDYELASLHVKESHRRRGIGSILVRRLLEDFEATHGSQLEHLFLLTLTDTATFYGKLGFEVVPSANDIPGVLKAERAVGSFLQWFFGNSLVCMRAKSG